MTTADPPIYAAIEAGGTKWICAVGHGPDSLTATVRIPTTSPQETLDRVVAFFAEHQQRQPLRALGIGAFGPVDLRPRSPTYGFITDTPKPGWAYTDVAGMLGRALGVRVAFDTDVNAALVGEWRWGAAQNTDVAVYLTVGTGIGGGAVVGGRLVHGLIHPEMGHMRIPHDMLADPFPGMCVYHGDCLEGLACGPAMAARWGRPAESLPHDHPAWELEAQYLGAAMANLLCVLSPQRIIVGGGVMAHPTLLLQIRSATRHTLAGYLRAVEPDEQLEQLIVPPALGTRSGLLGALALAMEVV